MLIGDKTMAAYVAQTYPLFYAACRTSDPSATPEVWRVVYWDAEQDEPHVIAVGTYAMSLSEMEQDGYEVVGAPVDDEDTARRLAYALHRKLHGDVV